MICAGGGGIPTMYERGANRKLIGVEAVIDKDLCSELLARELNADLFVMLTDAEAVYLDWGKPTQKADPQQLTVVVGGYRVRRGIDGAEGAGGVPLRGRDRQPGGDRRVGGSGPDHRGRGRHHDRPEGTNGVRVAGQAANRLAGLRLPISAGECDSCSQPATLCNLTILTAQSSV